MKVEIVKWTKTRTINAENDKVEKKLSKYQSQYLINVLEMIRANLSLNVNKALAQQDAWAFNLNNDFEAFKNKLSVAFINWGNILPLVWRTEVIDIATNEDISLALEVSSIEIFVIDRSLISNSISVTRKNTRKQKIKELLRKYFQTFSELITQEDTSVVAVRVFNGNLSSNDFYEIHFSLDKSNPFLPYQDFEDVYKSNDKEMIQRLKDKFNAQINEMDIQDEKFFYGLRVNIVFSTYDNFHDDVSRDKTVFPFYLLKDTASRLFR